MSASKKPKSNRSGNQVFIPYGVNINTFSWIWCFNIILRIYSNVLMISFTNKFIKMKFKTMWICFGSNATDERLLLKMYTSIKNAQYLFKIGKRVLHKDDTVLSLLLEIYIFSNSSQIFDIGKLVFLNPWMILYSTFQVNNM